MRRLGRHLLTLTSAVSLLLCVALCVLWVRSYRQRDSAYASRWTRDGRELSAWQVGGRVCVGVPRAWAQPR